MLVAGLILEPAVRKWYEINALTASATMRGMIVESKKKKKKDNGISIKVTSLVRTWEER